MFMVGWILCDVILRLLSLKNFRLENFMLYFDN